MDPLLRSVSQSTLQRQIQIERAVPKEWYTGQNTDMTAPGFIHFHKLKTTDTRNGGESVFVHCQSLPSPQTDDNHLLTGLAAFTPAVSPSTQATGGWNQPKAAGNYTVAYSTVASLHKGTVMWESPTPIIFEVEQDGLLTGLSLSMLHYKENYNANGVVQTGAGAGGSEMFSASQLPLQAAQFVKEIRLVTLSGKIIETIYPEAIASQIMYSDMGSDAKKSYLNGFHGYKMGSKIRFDTAQTAITPSTSSYTSNSSLEYGLRSRQPHSVWFSSVPRVSSFGAFHASNRSSTNDYTQFSIPLLFSCFSSTASMYDTRFVEGLRIHVIPRNHHGHSYFESSPLAGVTYSMEGKFLRFPPETNALFREIQFSTGLRRVLGTTWVCLPAIDTIPSFVPPRSIPTTNMPDDPSYFGSGVVFRLSDAVGLCKSIALFCGSVGPNLPNKGIECALHPDSIWQVPQFDLTATAGSTIISQASYQIFPYRPFGALVSGAPVEGTTTIEVGPNYNGGPTYDYVAATDNSPTSLFFDKSPFSVAPGFSIGSATTWACQDDVTIASVEIVGASSRNVFYDFSVCGNGETNHKPASYLSSHGNSPVSSLNGCANEPHPSLRFYDLSHNKSGSSAFGGGISFHLLGEEIMLHARPSMQANLRGVVNSGIPWPEKFTGHFWPDGSRCFMEMYVMREIDGNGRVLNILSV